MDNDEKMLLSIGWLVFGNLILIIILNLFGINAVNYKDPTFITGAIIIIISALLSIFAIAFYSHKSAEETRAWREKQYPISRIALIETRNEMIGKYPRLRSQIETITSNELNQLAKNNE